MGEAMIRNKKSVHASIFLMLLILPGCSKGIQFGPTPISATSPSPSGLRNWITPEMAKTLADIEASTTDSFLLYSKKEMGYSFLYPKTWSISYESAYQTSVNEIEGKKSYPTVCLQKNGSSETICINSRQCTTEIALLGDNWMCLDDCLLQRQTAHTVRNINEVEGLVKDETYNAIAIIFQSFSLLPQ
jgi:hypothetical protein